MSVVFREQSGGVQEAPEETLKKAWTCLFIYLMIRGGRHAEK